jgi:predicted O-methyltransferase YrrM
VGKTAASNWREERDLGIEMESLLHLLRFMIGKDPAASQVTDRELQMLLRYSHDARIICEIGCYEARTSVAFARNTTGTVYSVDPFYRGRLGICYTECIARLNRSRMGVRNLSFLKGLSLEVGPEFNAPIDFLFIDADHSYEAAKADWNEWFPKVRKKGYIALHDSKLAANSPHKIGSMRFYTEDLAYMEGVVECDSVDSLVIVQSR